MKKGMTRLTAAGAILAAAAGSAAAATARFDFDYMATGLKGNFAAASGGTAVKVGSITLTDLSDLSLGDGKSGVRASITLDGLNQFSSGAGAIFISSYELNFPGTGTAGPGGIELSSATEGLNWRYVSGLNVNAARAGGPIEFAEDGATNGWGAVSGDPSFEQEINYVTGAFTNGVTSIIDFLNGDNGYAGFSVANVLANPVHNTNSALPGAYAWIKIRSTGGGIANGNNGKWWEPAVFNSAGGRLDVLAVTPVPEPQTYAMLLAGLGLLAVGVRRRMAAS
jgi:hypothetical protein